MGGSPNKQLVSCCLIVLDEREHLPDCVEAVAGIVDEFVVYDTGSTDGTPELARDLGCRVILGEWRDDFAWARNQVLPEAAGAWTLVLDADDRLRHGDRLRELLATDPEVDALMLEVASEVRAEDGTSSVHRCWQPRVFRTTAGIRYRHAVHEIPGLSGHKVGVGPGSIEHLGYLTPEQRRARAPRLLALLAKLPEDEPHRWYHEARTAGVLDDHEAVDAASRRLAALSDVMSPDARFLWSQALLKLARPVEAAEVLLAGLRDHPDHPDLFYGLFAAGGFGFLATAAPILREPTWFPGTLACLDRGPQVAATLVEQQVLTPSIFDSPLLEGLLPPAASSPRQGAS